MNTKELGTYRPTRIDLIVEGMTRSEQQWLANLELRNERNLRGNRARRLYEAEQWRKKAIERILAARPS